MPIQSDVLGEQSEKPGGEKRLPGECSRLFASVRLKREPIPRRIGAGKRAAQRLLPAQNLPLYEKSSEPEKRGSVEKATVGLWTLHFACSEGYGRSAI